MGTIVVGYVPSPEGEAALDRAVDEATLRGSNLVVVNSQRGGRTADYEEMALTNEQVQVIHDRLHAAGIEHDVRGLIRGNDPADDLVAIAEEMSAETDRHRPAQAHPGGQADHGQQRPEDPLGRHLSGPRGQARRRLTTPLPRVGRGKIVVPGGVDYNVTCCTNRGQASGSAEPPGRSSGSPQSPVRRPRMTAARTPQGGNRSYERCSQDCHQDCQGRQGHCEEDSREEARSEAGR